MDLLVVYRLHFGWELGLVVSFMDLLVVDLLVILLRISDNLNFICSCLRSDLDKVYNLSSWSLHELSRL